MIGNLNIYRNKTPNFEVNGYAESLDLYAFVACLLMSFSTVPSPPPGHQKLSALFLAVSPLHFR